MLKTRIITAIVLLAILLPVLFSHSYLAFATLALVFYACAAWENQRLFGSKQAVLVAAIWSALFAYLLWQNQFAKSGFLFGLCVGIWLLRLSPNLALGLPALGTLGNRLLGNIYSVAILGCFVAIVTLFQHSPAYLLSSMALVWIADIGAYFSGRRFGKRKLAVTISPGKSWEGAIGGAIAVVVLSVLAIVCAPQATWLQDTFVLALQQHWGWPVSIILLLCISAASVVGDLIESQLKRRIGMKDSSGLLPG
ncbi:MAG: phosphatidate cytidylyltransferase, partial [Burkholderiales bacterium]|nr:phosphatidate cytidylyltransferase [Burkholderiales bacterium]